jgi:DnaJ-class molecular chaperone
MAKIEVPETITCPDCDGAKTVLYSYGWDRNGNQAEGDCLRCHGEGTIPIAPCFECEGAKVMGDSENPTTCLSCDGKGYEEVESKW